jgi:hypothetical protein
VIRRGWIVVLLAGCQDTGVMVVCEPACPVDRYCTSAGCVPAQAPRDMARAVDLLPGPCGPGCSYPTPICDSSGRCVTCVSDGDCDPGQLCRTLGAATACVPGCRADSGCKFLSADGRCCDGQCLYTDTDAQNCGACGVACSRPNASGTCVHGVCALGICAPGWGDCNLDPADGCETNLATDTASCGACGRPCALAHASSACDGACFIAGCQVGWADCNQALVDGCERATGADVNNCGACGHVCRIPPNATAGCVSGNCVMAACAGGFVDCDGDPGNGCESDPTRDASNCGQCGNVCPHVCFKGVCF